MKVGDIMIRKVCTIRPDNTLKECVAVLNECKVNGLVVVEKDKVAGVITKQIFLRQSSRAIPISLRRNGMYQISSMSRNEHKSFLK
jgi:CBS domain-containing protein